MKYYENVVFPESSRAVIDVTKPPYCLDPTGKEDCTEKLNSLINNILSELIVDMKKVYDKLCTVPSGTYISHENRVDENGVIRAIMPNDINQIPMLYFPNGTYLISDTITYSLRNLKNMMYVYTSGGFELNRCIRLIGQSREGTVIKLKDNCKGFEYGQRRSVIDFMLGERSNVAMSNYLENMTIDVGKGNPGAVGLVFFANNSGAVRNVTIKSSDENYDGAVGLVIKHEIHSACNIYSVTIEGFDYGVEVSTYRTVSHFENITLLHPKKYGFKIDNNAVQIIGLKAESDVPVVFVAGPMAHVVITDAYLNSKGTKDYSAIKHSMGIIFLRNINTSGFKTAYEKNWFEIVLPDGHVDEYCTAQGHTLFDKQVKSLALEVPPLPDVELEQDLDKWCCVNDFGAVGDGEHDDTVAISKAFASGAPVIWFQPGHYLITRPVDIPATVKHIHFMYCDICTDEYLRDAENEAVFIIKGESDDLLFIEKLFSWGRCYGNMRMFRQDCKRDVYMRDMHTQDCNFYFNTVSGSELFFENCASTACKKYVYGHIPGFEFNGQTAWCHSINPERSMKEVVNKGGILWWSGFKTEQEGAIAITTDGGVTEILGGVAVAGTGSDIALIENIDSDVSAIFTNTGYHEYSTYPNAVRETRDGEVRIIHDTQLPARCAPWYFMPLYSGRGRKRK